MANSTQSGKRGKAAGDRASKPYFDFPLTPHPAGYWCKSIRGKLRYFGRWGRRRKGSNSRWLLRRCKKSVFLLFAFVNCTF